MTQPDREQIREREQKKKHAGAHLGGDDHALGAAYQVVVVDDSVVKRVSLARFQAHPVPAADLVDEEDQLARGQRPIHSYGRGSGSASTRAAASPRAAPGAAARVLYPARPRSCVRARRPARERPPWSASTRRSPSPARAPRPPRPRSRLARYGLSTHRGSATGCGTGRAEPPPREARRGQEPAASSR